MAITVPTLTTAVMSAAPQHQAGTASGINNAVSRAAGLLAVAIFGVLVATTFTSSLDGALDAIPSLSPEARQAVEAQRGELAAASPPEAVDAETASAIEAAIDVAFVSGFRQAMLVGAAMAALSALAAWWLIEGKRDEG